MSKQGLPQSNVFVINSMAGETVPLSVTSTSSTVAFALPASINNYDVIVTNAGTKTAFVNFGLASAGTVTAQVPGTSGTTGATPILAGAIVTLQKQSDYQKADTCAAICGGSDTTTLYFTSIQGS
jgi:NAD/NADP transhydrogenase alpha subunit